MQGRCGGESRQPSARERSRGLIPEVGPAQRKREEYYTYPALRLIQVLPGHPLADSQKMKQCAAIQRRTSL